MFEVGVKGVKDEIQHRIQVYLDDIFEHYEAVVIDSSLSIC